MGDTITVDPCQVDVETGGVAATGQATTVQILLQLGIIPSEPNQTTVTTNPTTGQVTVINPILGGVVVPGSVTLVPVTGAPGTSPG